MTVIYACLFLAIATGVMQATLDKAGVGRAENSASNLLVLLSIPITWLSNLGLIAITIWSFFVLPWLPTLCVVAGAFVGFSLVWSVVLATLRRGHRWLAVLAMGAPLVFILRLLCAACTVYLGITFWQGMR